MDISQTKSNLNYQPVDMNQLFNLISPLIIANNINAR